MRRLAVSIVLFVCSGLLISGCVVHSIGTAATVGSYKISAAAVNDLVGEINEVLKDQSAKPKGDQIIRAVLSDLIREYIVNIVAERESLETTETAILADRLILESQHDGVKNFEVFIAKQGVAPSKIDSVLRQTQILSQLGEKLAKDVPTEVQRIKIQLYLSELSQELGVTVNPRFGSWNLLNVSVVAPHNPFVRD